MNIYYSTKKKRSREATACVEKANCPNFDNCNAPLCPLDDTSITKGIWYPDEDICKSRNFQNLDWIRKQKAIVKAEAPHDRFFTVEMLQAIKQVRRGIEGISPDQPLKQAEQAVEKWIIAKIGGRVIAKQN